MVLPRILRVALLLPLAPAAPRRRPFRRRHKRTRYPASPRLYQGKGRSLPCLKRRLRDCRHARTAPYRRLDLCRSRLEHRLCRRRRSPHHHRRENLSELRLISRLFPVKESVGFRAKRLKGPMGRQSTSSPAESSCKCATLTRSAPLIWKLTVWSSGRTATVKPWQKLSSILEVFPATIWKSIYPATSSFARRLW